MNGVPVELALVEITLDRKPLYFYTPYNDDTSIATQAAIIEDEFKLDNIEFNQGDVVLDIGSNVCLLSLVLAKLHPYIQIYAFDPNPIACFCAKASRCRNSITNLDVFNVAVGAENEKDVKFYSNSSEISASVQEEYTSLRDRVYKSDVIKIDDLFDSLLLGINKVKYLKIDIEGGEYKLMNHIIDNRPDIIERIENLHLEVHGYPWRDELVERVKGAFGNKWINQ